MLVAERIADRTHPLAHPQRRRIAERRHRQAGLAVDLDQRDVGVGIGADDAGAQAAAVRQLDGDALGALDDVVVRQDAAVGVDDEAAAGAAARGSRSNRGVPKSNGSSNRSGGSGIGVRAGAGGPRRPSTWRRCSRRPVDPLDDVGEVDELERALRRSPAFEIALGASDLGAGHDRRPRDAAGEDGPDEKRHDGGQGEGDEGEATRHIQVATCSPL